MFSRRQFLCSLALLSLTFGIAHAKPEAPPQPQWVVAHRGGSKLAPENTLKAFNNAVRLGSNAFELDIHLTKDGDLVVIHDHTLTRTSHKEGVVGEMTLAEIKKADSSIPSLREALRAAKGRCHVLVEIKAGPKGRYIGLEKVLLEQLSQEKMLSQVVVISFNQDSLKELRSKVTTGLLYAWPLDPAQVKKDLGVQYLCPQAKLVTPKLVQDAHSLGLKVNAWTVNDKAEMLTLLQAGIDAITTDLPDQLKQVLAARK
jgi:glycerophosphoryl diester phosphodiesterase